MPSSNLQKEKQRNIFSKSFVNYGHRSSQEGWKRAYVKRIFEIMPPVKNGKFLDVGTGSGFMVIEAAKRGMEAVGIDIFPESIKLSVMFAKKDLTPEQRKKVKFFVADAEKLPFKDSTFDRVCSRAEKRRRNS